MPLLAESALSADDVDLIRGAAGHTVGHLLAPKGPEFAAVLFALHALQVIVSKQRSKSPTPAPNETFDPLDADAVRQRVRARLALVQEADYFALLGVKQSATPYDIRRAYVELRRAFDPSQLLTGATVDLREDVELIIDVLEEAYQVLRDHNRRTRYKRAIESTRPSNW